MDARIQMDEEKQIPDQDENPSPAASKSQKANQSRPNSSALETLGGEALTNGGLELPSSVTPSHSKRASDCSNLSTSESMDYGTSLSADLSLNKETGSLSLKVTSPVTLGPGQACWPICHAQAPFSKAGRSYLHCI
jgi:serine/threonine-protein kinase 10